MSLSSANKRVIVESLSRVTPDEDVDGLQGVIVDDLRGVVSISLIRETMTEATYDITSVIRKRVTRSSTGGITVSEVS